VLSDIIVADASYLAVLTFAISLYASRLYAVSDRVGMDAPRLRHQADKNLQARELLTQEAKSLLNMTRFSAPPRRLRRRVFGFAMGFAGLIAVAIQAGIWLGAVHPLSFHFSPNQTAEELSKDLVTVMTILIFILEGVGIYVVMKIGDQMTDRLEEFKIYDLAGEPLPERSLIRKLVRWIQTDWIDGQVRT
jgi:hypothetical protein